MVEAVPLGLGRQRCNVTDDVVAAASLVTPHMEGTVRSEGRGICLGLR